MLGVPLGIVLALAGAVLLALVVVVAVVVVRAYDDPGRSCDRGADLVPTCGVLLGVTPPAPDLASLARTEEALHHRFAMVYTFHDIDDTVPSAYERALVARGTVLHISIDARVYGQPLGVVTWAAIAAGSEDAALTRTAQGIASLHRPVFLTFDHEPDQPVKAVEGSPADFVAAWRHVHDLFARAGATNVVWVWVVTGWAGSEQTALRMWPGNAYVDWIGWEAYDSRGCFGGSADAAPIDFAQAALPFRTWLGAHAAEVGMDLGKPMMISEAGTARPADGAVNTGWFAGMEKVLHQHPEIKAVTWWDHTGSAASCDYTFTGDPTLRRSAAGTAARGVFGG